jgi:hypothetical protein
VDAVAQMGDVRVLDDRVRSLEQGRGDLDVSTAIPLEEALEARLPGPGDLAVQGHTRAGIDLAHSDCSITERTLPAGSVNQAIAGPMPR